MLRSEPRLPGCPRAVWSLAQTPRVAQPRSDASGRSLHLSRQARDAGFNDTLTAGERRPRGVGINGLVNPNGKAWRNEYVDKD